jgi:hypothetical protein
MLTNKLIFKHLGRLLGHVAIKSFISGKTRYISTETMRPTGPTIPEAVAEDLAFLGYITPVYSAPRKISHWTMTEAGWSVYMAELNRRAARQKYDLAYRLKRASVAGSKDYVPANHWLRNPDEVAAAKRMVGLDARIIADGIEKNVNYDPLAARPYALPPRPRLGSAANGLREHNLLSLPPKPA